MVKPSLNAVISILLMLAGGLAAAAQPNRVFIIADDCTYLDMEVYGGQGKTPQLNRLAQAGMQFSRCFQAAPMCSPTRHNIYTGLYPVKSGAWPNHTCVYPRFDNGEQMWYDQKSDPQENLNEAGDPAYTDILARVNYPLDVSMHRAGRSTLSEQGK